MHQLTLEPISIMESLRAWPKDAKDGDQVAFRDYQDLWHIGMMVQGKWLDDRGRPLNLNGMTHWARLEVDDG